MLSAVTILAQPAAAMESAPPRRDRELPTLAWPASAENSKEQLLEAGAWLAARRAQQLASRVWPWARETIAALTTERLAAAGPSLGAMAPLHDRGAAAAANGVKPARSSSTGGRSSARLGGAAEAGRQHMMSRRHRSQGV